MKCPFCSNDNSKVLESRNGANGKSIRRRRECVGCKNRFTTYETIEHSPVTVIKKDNRREEFNRDKLKRGLITATEKRNISIETINSIVLDIELEFSSRINSEIKTDEIGLAVMKKLKKIDKVAYVRFASVYKEFSDLESFREEIEKLSKNKTL